MAFHVAAGMGFKKTIEKDEISKGEAERRAAYESKKAGIDAV